MQQQQPLLSTQDFNMAADIDPQNADVYHHRGQVHFLPRVLTFALRNMIPVLRRLSKVFLCRFSSCEQSITVFHSLGVCSCSPVLNICALNFGICL